MRALRLALPAALLAITIALPAAAEPMAPVARDTIVFAGGCFWGVQAVFARVKGVVSSTSGYAGGNVVRPSYEQVSTGQTGHAESVQVVYDPATVSIDQLLQVFFSVAHDPTELNRQGPDEGTQYRSAIFYTSDAQKETAERVKAQWEKSGKFSRPITTEITKAAAFYSAEEYHQKYLVKNPGGYTCHVLRD